MSRRRRGGGGGVGGGGREHSRSRASSRQPPCLGVGEEHRGVGLQGRHLRGARLPAEPSFAHAHAASRVAVAVSAAIRGLGSTHHSFPR